MTAEPFQLTIALLGVAAGLLFLLRRRRARQLEHLAILRHLRAYCS